jgi:replicative superfamily II helicase
MMDQVLETSIRKFGINEFVDRAGEASLAREISAVSVGFVEQPNTEKLPRLGYLFENQGILAYENLIVTPSGENQESVRTLFERAFICWQSLVTLGSIGYDNNISPSIVETVSSELINEPINAELSLCFRLAVSGLLSKRSAETRLELNRFDLLTENGSSSWRDKVASNVFYAFVLLVRKKNGWEDIDAALKRIGDLRDLQKEFEANYIDSKGSETSQVVAAVELVGLYHLAQMITITGDYLENGNGSIDQVNIRLDRHKDRALSAFESVRMTLFEHLVALLWVGCREITNNAIWTHVNSLGEKVRDFARLLSARGREKPVIELWPSQQEALTRNLLDPYRRAVLVEMPTSAGKTLLAKFSIVQTKALNPAGTVAYVVPTRALVNQVTLDMRYDFEPLKWRVEQAVPAFELDPTEDKLLDNGPDILVTTPEKLDLLIRRNHRSTQNIVLIIVDEAHNIREGNRGVRLELLLGTIKRDRPNSRFLLLSPFLPNSQELVTWLGNGRALPPIRVDWRPGRRLVGSLRVRGRGKNRALIFETLPAIDNTDVRENVLIPISLADSLDGSENSVSSLTKAAVKALIDRGSLLVLCRGKGTAASRAQDIAGILGQISPDQKLAAVLKFLEAEAGYKSGLIECLQHGVAYHHAGLSHEARWLIEGLIRAGKVKVICGTTTLAQGVNFPISTVIVETLKKGDQNLSYQDFWNIAGRAGRTLIDNLGVVAFPTPNANKQREVVEFLQGEADEISSQLASLIDQADEISQNFNLAALKNWPQLTSLLQFLSHAMHVSGNNEIADDVEDILRSSLVYYQARRQGEAVYRRLVKLCRSYLEIIRNQKGAISLADQTGFATPSVLNLLSRTRDRREFSEPNNWKPERLFGENLQPLTERISAIADLPEIQLGQSTHPPFSAERVAAILRDWVRGDSLESLTQKHWVEENGDKDDKVSNFSSYLFSQLLGRASWGIGALEGVSLVGQDSDQVESVGYIPSMIFFGVQKKEAVWLRMIGVPRIVANGLGNIWQKNGLEEPKSYDEIRTWVNSLSDDQWEEAIPKYTTLTPGDMREIWKSFIGA